MVNNKQLRKQSHEQRRLLGICTCSACESKEMADFERKSNLAGIILITCIIGGAIMVLLFATGTVHAAEGLGQNESEFQTIKTTIAKQLLGSEATLSEVDPDKFSDKDIKNIERARQQLGTL